MEILQSVIVILFFVTCAVLIFLVLIQSGKGGSMGIMGGGGSQSAFGSSTVDVVEKATWYAGVAFFVLAILAAIAFADGGPDILPGNENPASQEQSTPVSTPNGNTTTPAPQQNNAPQP